MDYKEKLEEAKKLYASANVDQKYVLESLFPELTEQNGEKVKQKIINLIKKSNEVGGWALHKWEADEMLAWLEKQGQKPIMNVPSREVILSIWDLGNEWKELTNGCISTEHGAQLDYILKHWNESEYYLKYLKEKQGMENDIDDVYPIFNVGDWVVNKFGDAWHIDSFDKKNYQVSDGKGNYNYFPIAKQDEMHHWSIGDVKDGDVLACGSNIFIFHFINSGRLMEYCHANTNDGRFYNDIGKSEYFYFNDVVINPATKEQYDTLMKAMTDAGLEFDFKKKELKKIEDKPQLKEGNFYECIKSYHYLGGGQYWFDKGKVYFCEKDGYLRSDPNNLINVYDCENWQNYFRPYIEKTAQIEEDEEYNGEDYGIDSLYHAQRILEKTLGEVDGYQSDDGILEHKCAISAVKKLYEQKPAKWTAEDEQNLNVVLSYINDDCLRKWLKDAIHKKYDKPAEWTEEDESMYTRTLGILGKCYMGQLPTKVEDELKWLKSLNTQKNLKQICNTVDLSKNKNKALDLLYNELLEKYKGE